jgi:hypothetical protein
MILSSYVTASIRQQRKGKAVAVAEGAVAIGALRINAKYYCIAACPFRRRIAKLTQLLGAHRRLVAGVKHKNAPPASEIRQRYPVSILVGKVERWRGCARGEWRGK